jgi:hypothetical protein
MRRKIILRLSLLIAFMTVLWSCHNEDFAKGETEPQRNNANFFKHQSSTTAKSGVDYVSILEEYNREKNFLTTMPDQKGMPVWDKMQVVDTENATGLMIPLSHDNETMSSVLFAMLDDKNSVTGIRDFDNKMLEEIVYNEKIDKDFREKMFNTFMYLDNKTFGTEQFTGLPKDLFTGKKYDDTYGRIEIKGFENPKNATINETGKILWVETCGVYWQCSHHGEGSCDHCMALCHVVSCNMTMIYIETGDDFPGSPIGSGGGGGGGGGTPGPQPPKDPCSLSDVFYRLAPQCGGGNGGNTEIPDLDDPCAKAKPSIDKANAILKSQPGINMTNALNAKIGAPKEWAVAIGNTTGNQTETTPAVEQNVTDGVSPVGLLSPGSTLIGDGHSHRSNPGNPSAGDLYHMLNELFSTENNHIPNPNFLYRFVYGNTNGVKEIYALVINDLTLAQEFLQQFPMAENYDENTHSFKDYSPLWEEVDKMKILYNAYPSQNISGETYDSRSVGLAYIFDKFNAGISVSKVDANGNLKKINAVIQNEGTLQEKPKVSKCP